MYTKGKISAKDYRKWFMLNHKTHISILTPLREKETASIIHGIGQRRFAASNKQRKFRI